MEDDAFYLSYHEFKKRHPSKDSDNIFERVNSPNDEPGSFDHLTDWVDEKEKTQKILKNGLLRFLKVKEIDV